jgi:nucleoside-diphosphate-sugar epimerase
VENIGVAPNPPNFYYNWTNFLRFDIYHHMKKALVTGGAGFIGSSVVGLLLNEGWKVTILDNFITGNADNIKPFMGKARFVFGDIRDYAKLVAECHGVDCIFHLAAHCSVRESMVDPKKTHDNNVVGTENVYRAAKEMGVKKIIFSSSCAVYPTALSPYAKSKLVGEQMAADYHDNFGIASVCLRYFNVYGPRQNGKSDYAAAVPRFVDSAIKNRGVIINGDGNQTRDFIFVEDVARANLIAANRLVLGTYNVRTSHAVTINALWDIIKDETKTTVGKSHTWEMAGEVKHAIPDPKVPDLDFVPAYTLAEGIKQTVLGRLGSVATATHS